MGSRWSARKAEPLSPKVYPSKVFAMTKKERQECRAQCHDHFSIKKLFGFDVNLKSLIVLLYAMAGAFARLKAPSQ